MKHLALLLLGAAACGGARASAGGTGAAADVYTVDLHARTVQASPPMIAKPLPRRLLLVVDPQKVADTLPIAKWQQRGKTAAVAGVQQYVAASLQKTLGAYFRDVAVVAPGFAEPSEPYVVADLRVDGVEARSIATGSLTYVILNLTWAIAVRPSEADEYLFSFAGVAPSAETYGSLEEGCDQMMRSALHGLLESWTEKDVFGALAAADRAAPKRTKKASTGTVDL
jgi:hypothetical protein